MKDTTATSETPKQSKPQTPGAVNPVVSIKKEKYGASM